MKRRMLLLSMTVVVGFTFLGCQSSDERTAGNESTNPATQGAKATHRSSAHPIAKPKPGSYEDWCDEHKVPESLCTQCNPALAAAFKATGDWCEQHALPESQCRACNPDLRIERPPNPAEGA